MLNRSPGSSSSCFPAFESYRKEHRSALLLSKPGEAFFRGRTRLMGRRILRLERLPPSSSSAE